MNILFVGIDGKGKNATIRICDFEMYKDLFDLQECVIKWHIPIFYVFLWLTAAAWLAML